MKEAALFTDVTDGTSDVLVVLVTCSRAYPKQIGRVFIIAVGKHCLIRVFQFLKLQLYFSKSLNMKLIKCYHFFYKILIYFGSMRPTYSNVWKLFPSPPHFRGLFVAILWYAQISKCCHILILYFEFII